MTATDVVAERRVRVQCPHCPEHFLVVIPWKGPGRIQVDCLECERRIEVDV